MKAIPPDPRKSDLDYVKTKEILAQSIIDFCGSGTFFSFRDDINGVESPVLHNYFDTGISPLPHTYKRPSYAKLGVIINDEMYFCACGTLTQPNCLDGRIYFLEGFDNFEPGAKACIYGAILSEKTPLFLEPSKVLTENFDKLKVYDLHDHFAGKIVRYIIPESIYKKEGYNIDELRKFFKKWIESEQK